ncbi:MAG: hypothetical protein OQK75_10325 [Gammaproteobacteria bacterium]|nr:hypothetical protein [Gammaproteobacteria bacterium]MCW8988046.1 hypothetical protein [Gammaproteobacteria bacterium]MCW9031120.1 hypothetical protein [Gammaproteobacteria bacterium]
MNEKTANSSLHQESSARGEKRVFEIYNNKFIKVTTNNFMHNNSYHLNLSMLAPWPVRHRDISWQWLLAVFYFAITTLAYTAYLFYFQESSKLERLLPFIVIFLLLSLGSFLMFLYRSPNVIEFRSRYGNCVVLSLLYNNPEQKIFKAFIEEIKLRSLLASQAIKIDKNQMLDIEMNELKRMRNEGVISQHHYADAKARILQVKL